MPAIPFRKSAVAMMIVAGGLAAAVSSYAPPAQGQPSKGSQTAIPCNLTPKEKRARQKTTIPCDTRKSAKKDGAMGPLGAQSPRKKDGVVMPCDVRASKKEAHQKTGSTKRELAKKRGSDKLGDIK